MRSTPAPRRRLSSRRDRTSFPCRSSCSVTSRTSAARGDTSTTTAGRSLSTKRTAGTGRSITRPGNGRSMSSRATRPRRSRAIRPVSKSSTAPRWSRSRCGTDPPSPARWARLPWQLRTTTTTRSSTLRSKVAGEEVAVQVWRDEGYGNIWLDRRPDKTPPIGSSARMEHHL